MEQVPPQLLVDASKCGTYTHVITGHDRIQLFYVYTRSTEGTGAYSFNSIALAALLSSGEPLSWREWRHPQSGKHGNQDPTLTADQTPATMITAMPMTAIQEGRVAVYTAWTTTAKTIWEYPSTATLVPFSFCKARTTKVWARTPKSCS